jgi:hypothetical protein
MTNKTYPPSADMAANAHINAAKYEEMYAASIADPVAFWAEHGKRIDWIKPFNNVRDVSFAKEDLHIRWFDDGELNVCANCVDRHLPARADQTARKRRSDPGPRLSACARQRDRGRGRVKPDIWESSTKNCNKMPRKQKRQTKRSIKK